MNRWLKKIPAWRREALWLRCSACISLLYVHGLLSESEKERARKRLRKAFNVW